MPMQLRTRNILAAAVITAGVAFGAQANTVDTALENGAKRVNKAQQSQKKIDAVEDKIRAAEADYRVQVKQIDDLKVYVKQLDAQLNDQQNKLSELEASIKQVKLVERQITPLMLKMTNALAQFVKADVPFLADKRQGRVAGLFDLMKRSDVTVAEKYRKVMDAYQAEVDYGRSIESYRGTLELNGQAREVDFLRVGRIALVYQSLDGKELGVWNNTLREWQPLDASYKGRVMAGIRIAREQAAPALIEVPVAAPQEAK